MCFQRRLLHRSQKQQLQPETEKKQESIGNKGWLCAALGGGAVLVLGGIVVVVISKFKKKKEEGIVEEGLEFADDTPYINEDEEKAAEQK